MGLVGGESDHMEKCLEIQAGSGWLNFFNVLY